MAKKLLEAAKAGDVEKIFELAGGGGGGGDDDDADDDEGGGANEADGLAYKWLLVAGDFGHADADEAADDMLETSSFRYDDDHMMQGLVHLELGEAYLAGGDGLAVDLEKARAHLQIAKQLEVHETTDVGKGFPALRKKLSAAAREVFDSVFGATKPSKPPVPKGSV
jgi:hypothetical protein